MHRRVATRRPAGAAADERGVGGVAEDDFAGGGLHLRVALDAEVRVALVKKFLRERAVRRVAGDAAFAQRLVAEDVRLALLAMAVGAGLVQAREGEAALGFVDVEAVGVVALGTMEFAFENLVVVRQAELCVGLDVAGEARLRRLARVDDELVPTLSAGLDVLAAWPVARLAAGLACEARAVRVEAPVRAGGEGAGVVRVAVGAGVVADEGSALNDWRGRDGALNGGAGTEGERDAGGDEERRDGQPAEELFGRRSHGRSVP